MSEMNAQMFGPAFEAELAYRRETAQRFVRAGSLGGGTWRRIPRRRLQRRQPGVGRLVPALPPHPFDGIIRGNIGANINIEGRHVLEAVH